MTLLDLLHLLSTLDFYTQDDQQPLRHRGATDKVVALPVIQRVRRWGSQVPTGLKDTLQGSSDEALDWWLDHLTQEVKVTSAEIARRQERRP